MGFKALVVDDDRAIREAVQMLLSFEDFEVRLAGDGLTGLRMAREERPDVIILDVMMPGLDGYGVAERLGADPSLSDVPIVFCSALAGEADVWEGWLGGAASYVPKPFDVDRLVSEVLRVVTAPRSGAAVEGSLAGTFERTELSGDGQLLSQESFTAGDGDGFELGADVEAVEDGLDVVADGVGADRQFLGDVTGGVGLGDELEDLQLAWGQRASTGSR